MFHTPPVGQERIECATFEVWAKVFRAELIEPHRIIVIGRGTVYYKKKTDAHDALSFKKQLINYCKLGLSNLSHSRCIYY